MSTRIGTILKPHHWMTAAAVGILLFSSAPAFAETATNEVTAAIPADGSAAGPCGQDVLPQDLPEPQSSPDLSPMDDEMIFTMPPFLRTCRCSCGFPCTSDADCGPGGKCTSGITCCAAPAPSENDVSPPDEDQEPTQVADASSALPKG